MNPTRTNLSRRGFLTLAGTATAGGVLLSACAPTGGGGDGGGSTMAQPDGTVPEEYADRQRLVFWSTFTEHNGSIMDGLVEAYNTSQDAVYVEVQVQGGYGDTFEKVRAGLQAKVVPDLAMVGGSGWTSLYLTSSIASLSELLGDTVNLYRPEFVTEGTVRGETYWAPFARSTPLFYYNKDLFAQAGLPDRAPETWTELREWAPEFQGISSDGKDASLYGFSNQDGDWQFQGMLWNFGGSASDGLEVTIDSAESIATAEYTRSLIWDETGGYMSTDIVGDFQNGLLGAAAMSTASLRGLLDLVDFELGAGFMPSELEAAVPTGGGGIVVLDGIGDERKEAAADFLTFLAQPEQSATWTAGTGYILTNKDAETQQAYTDAVAETELFTLAADQLERARPDDAIRKWIPSVPTDIFGALEQIWGDGTDPAGLFTDLASDLQAVADDFRETYEDKVAE